MNSRTVSLLALNAIGGVAVLASYVHGLGAIPAEALWGGVPDSIQPIYTVNMLLAAAGYFLFTPYILFRLDPETTVVAGRFSYRLFHVLYALVLLFSALWLPLTALMLETPSAWLWAAIRLDLLLVGIGSAGLMLSLFQLPATAPRGRTLAIVGLTPFVLQTAVLDALVWPALF